MTAASREVAIREMFTLINTALSSLATGGIFFPNRPESKPAADQPWARVALQHVAGGQRTLQAQNQLYENEGTLIIQLFEPSGRGLAASVLTTPTLKALRAQYTPSLVWFREVTADEKGISEYWFQTNVSCIFQYDTRENP